MLCTLTVHDFVIVDRLELDFDNGFSVLTGETGAGKSILIDALQLTLGARADSAVIRDGASKADISASFSLNSAALQWLNEHDIDCSDQIVLLRRTIDANGRSKGYVNGVSVTGTQLREIGGLLVDIHGQHAHQALLKHDEQRLLLDRHANLDTLLVQLEKSFKQWQEIRTRIEEAKTQSERIQQDRERLQWQVQELEKLSPQIGEWESVTAEYDRLSHAASLINGVNNALSCLSESQSDVLTALSKTHHDLSEILEYDDALVSSTEMIESSRIQIQEVVYELKNYLSRMDLDSETLNTVQLRMEALYQCARQYHVLPENLPEEHQAKKEHLQKLMQSIDIEQLSLQEKQAKDQYDELAKQVSVRRHQAAHELSENVTAVMQGLHMQGGRFVVQVSPAPQAHAYGVDQVEFLVSGHANTQARALTKVASGGELARISLAISVIASKATQTPTLIFDEVDTGVGGAVAEVVGRLLRQLGGAHQVLCVTHLPQVACQAEHHFQVSKQSSDLLTSPVSQITSLNESERVDEIARMLGGVEITRATIDHAKDMLKKS